jgi:hypothetical protein
MPMLSRAQNNVIILTSGLSGSSVLTGLISRAGYWTGDRTHKKEYDTYENQDLIDLNLRLIEAAGYSGDYTREFSSEALARIGMLRGAVDDTPFRRFLATCDQRGPWIWKDPRLWLTIRFWKEILPLDDCRFILLTRDLRHAWVSSTLRRQIRSYSSLKLYEQKILDSITRFLDDGQLSYLHLVYENMIVRPEEAIAQLNAHLDINLSVEDLMAIYHSPLYKVPRSSPMDYIKAGLIYAKNYRERLDRVSDKRVLQTRRRTE